MKRPSHLPLSAQLRRRRGETAELHVIAPAAERARQVRRDLGADLRTHFREHRDTLAAYALVTWDNRGVSVSSVRTVDGPVGISMAPVFVHDALNRLVAEMAAHDAKGASA